MITDAFDGGVGSAIVNAGDGGAGEDADIFRGAKPGFGLGEPGGGGPPGR